MKDQQHKDMEELLKQFRAQKSSELDDFEREALEGFEMLDSKEDAIQAKKDLDERAHRELFAKEKETRRVYWFAAAGLFLVVGLSVYFILNNPAITQKDVAYVQPTEQKKPEEKIAAPVPAEEMPATTIVTTSGEKNDKKKVSKDLEPAKEIAVTEKKEETQPGFTSRAVLKPAGAVTKTAETSNPAAMEKADDAEDKDLVKGKIIAKDANLDAVTDSKNKELENELKRESKKNEGYTDELAKSEKQVLKESDDKKSSGKKHRSKQKSSVPNLADEESVADDRNEKTPVNNGVAGNGNYATSPVDNQTSSNYNNNNVATGATNTSPKSSVALNTAVPASADNDKSKTQEYNTPGNSLYYRGGESALKTELTTKLSEKNVNKKFDALLIVNEKKKVEKVNYLNVYDLTTEERDKVTEVLKGLSKFNFSTQPNSKGTFEYKVEYRP